jgi:hypothetical protein
MVCAMFVGNEKDEHYSDDEIRELVTLVWEWQWGVGRSLLDAISVSHADGTLRPTRSDLSNATNRQLRRANLAR